MAIHTELWPWSITLILAFKSKWFCSAPLTLLQLRNNDAWAVMGKSEWSEQQSPHAIHKREREREREEERERESGRWGGVRHLTLSMASFSCGVTWMKPGLPPPASCSWPPLPCLPVSVESGSFNICTNRSWFPLISCNHSKVRSINKAPLFRWCKILQMIDGEFSLGLSRLSL